MTTPLIMEPKSFTGTLSQDENKVDVRFSVSCHSSGQLAIIFDRFPLDESNRFIVKNHENGKFVLFSLTGNSSDSSFESNSIIFTSLEKNNCAETGFTVCPTAHYSSAKIITSSESVEFPVVVFQIKGFFNFSWLSSETPLGLVQMGGCTKDEANGQDIVSGFVKIISNNNPENLEKWLEDVDKFARHLKSIMSFALNLEIKSPIKRVYFEKETELHFYSQPAPDKSVYPIFDWLHLSDIFNCAIDYYFNENRLQVKNLDFAIKWFNMHAYYREAHLITSMTVLENLIDSSLSEEDGYWIDCKQFVKIRKKLRTVVKDEVKKWNKTDEQQNELVQKINEKFADIQRKSLIDKLYLLTERWGIDLEDIDKRKIQNAKNARDQVVHRGQYEPKKNTTDNLHDHIFLIREIVVRFILTALDFKGSYGSYLGGHHSREFRKLEPKHLPPKAD